MGYLTIGIPSYNGGFNFHDLFDSIKKLGLDESEYEIVVVDNASSDNSIQILEECKQKMPNLKFYQNKTNVGRIQNWNEVLKYVNGKYLIHMNVNDRFMDFNLREHLLYMDEHPDVAMVLTDLVYVFPDSQNIYPEWTQSGVIKIDDYIKKTFLDIDYMEYHSTGTLHQHIFRTSVISNHNLQFDPAISRTTDRVFAGEVAKYGGGKFYYTNHIMVRWQLNNSRYHNNVHLTYKNFDLDTVWMNEYKANQKLATLAGISLPDFLRSQAIWARYYMFKQKLAKYAGKLSIKIPSGGLEEITAEIYFNYIKAIAKFNAISLNYNSITYTAFLKAAKLPLRKYGILKRKPRSLNEIME